MKTWLNSVYSDGTECFVSNPMPSLNEKITIWIRVYDDAPIEHIFLRTAPNGEEKLTEALKKRVENGLAYYAADFIMSERRMSYHFYLVCTDCIYFYNQKEITTYIPDMEHDFVLLTDYVQPRWVQDAVFYQIFPERFCNGNPDNRVKSGEYQLNGHNTIQMEHWSDEPLPYEKGFCLDFYGGDLEGIRRKIPYLKELGVTALYLNPIFLAPSVHKYDCIDYFHVDPHFGGDQALSDLTEELHKNDMKLILDISINHTGTAHKWFNRDGLFFDKTVGAYNNPNSKERHYYFFNEETNDYNSWQNVKDLPTLNYTSEELRQIVYKDEKSVLRKWLKPPYSIDGWRFDVADVFGRNNEIQLAHELWPEIRQAIRQENSQAYILAEDWGDCAQYLQGNEWDAPMNYYGCARPLRQFLGETDLFMLRNDVLKNVKYQMTAEDLKSRIIQHYSRLPYVIWQNQFNLIDSHDVSRLHNNPIVHPEEYRGAVMMQFSLVGTPSVYYGDEASVDGTMVTFEGCRYPMPWQKEFKKNEQYQFYQKLISIRRQSRAMSKGGMKFLYAQEGIVVLARFWKDEMKMTIMSVNDKDKQVQIPVSSIGSSGPKDDRDLFGRTCGYSITEDGEMEITIPAHQAFLFDISID